MALYRKIFQKINWENKEIAETTPLGKMNLGKIDAAIDLIDTRIVKLSEDKAEKTDIENCVCFLEVEENSGNIVVRYKNGKTYDFYMYKLIPRLSHVRAEADRAEAAADRTERNFEFLDAQWRKWIEEQKALVLGDINTYSSFWKVQWRIWFEAQTTEIQETYRNWERQWEEFYDDHTNEIAETAEHWKDMWQKWFYDYVNNSSRELAYWKKLVTDDFTEYSSFWKVQWRIWFEAQTTEIQETYRNWERQWEEFFSNQIVEMQETNANWKHLWQAWFYDYVNGCAEEYSAWKTSIDKDFRDWWDSIKGLFDGEDISAFANKLVALNERMDKFEEFQNELTNTHSIYDSLNDSSDKAIFDGSNEPVEGKRVVFVVEKDSDVGAELEDVKRRLRAIEQAFDGLANEFTVYQILTDGGTWLYVNNQEADQTEQLLDDKGDAIRGKTIFVTK